MKRKKDLMDYLEQYIIAGKIQGECMLNGDYKKSNQAYKNLQKILNFAKNSTIQEVEAFYNTILNSTAEPNTVTSCCADMLVLGVNTKLAKESLLKVSKDINIHPILKSNAQLFLQEWDKGNIKPIN